MTLGLWLILSMLVSLVVFAGGLEAIPCCCCNCSRTPDWKLTVVRPLLLPAPRLLAGLLPLTPPPQLLSGARGRPVLLLW